MTPQPNIASVGRLAVLCAALLVAACANQTPPASVITDELSRVSFDPPPSGQAAVATQELGQPAATETAGKQMFLGNSAVGASSNRARATQTSAGAEINFENAEISEVARVILGEVLGVSYSIDSTLSGTVSIDSGGALNDRQLISVLESVLTMNGAVLIANGAGYKIVPADTTQGPGEVLSLAGDTNDVAPGFGSTIIPLRYIAASTAAQFARPLVHRAETVQFDDRLNLLVVVGSTAERQNVVDTLKDLDVDWLAGKSVGIFPLAVTTPEAMIPELEALFDSGDPFGDLAAANNVEFIPMSRLNAILAIAGQPEQIVQVDRWISRLDRGKAVGLQFYVYNLKHLPAVEVAALLSESFGGLSSPSANAAAANANNRAISPISIDRSQIGLRDDQFGVDDVASDVAPLDGAAAAAPRPDNAAVAESSAVIGDVKIVANKTNNSLLIRAAPQTYEAIEATLRRLDRAPLQVLIEATIVEVTLNDQLRYGVQYFIESGSFQAGFDNSNAAASAAADLINPLTRLPGFNFLFTPGSSRLLIDALASLTDVRVLSSPTLVVQDNNTATLTVGDDVPITTRTAVGVQNVDAPLVNNIEYRATGVTLRVTPRINSNEVVSLNVIQEVSRLSDPTDPGLTPIITQRRIDSSVNVQTGQTIVLGGLIQDTETRGRDQLPILGDIPVLGNLFGGTNNTATRTELIVLVKPRIIRSAEDARDVSEELRARMRSFSPVRAKSRFRPWEQRSDVAPSDEPALIEEPANAIVEADPAPAGAQGVAKTSTVAPSVEPSLPEASVVPASLQGDPELRPVLPALRPIAGDTPQPKRRPNQIGSAPDALPVSTPSPPEEPAGLEGELISAQPRRDPVPVETAL